MEYLHTMVRVTDLEASLDFYCGKFGLVEVRRVENEAGRFTLVFLAAPGDVELAAKSSAPLIELTYNWDPEVYSGGRNFGHLAYRVDDIYETCGKLMKAGSRIRFNMHYHAVGEPITDRTSVAFVFYPKGYQPKHVMNTHPGFIKTAIGVTML